jgi:hypothetical protein
VSGCRPRLDVAYGVSMEQPTLVEKFGLGPRVTSLREAVDAIGVEFSQFELSCEYSECLVGALREISRRGVVGAWASMFDDTPTTILLSDANPTVQGSFIAACGHGFKLCPAFGEGLTDLITNSTTQVPIDMFSPGRFVKGQPLIAKRPTKAAQQTLATRDDCDG